MYSHNLNWRMEIIDFDSTEVDPPINFYLSYLEEEIQSKLRDSEARITPGKSEGRVLLEIQEDSLANFIDLLRERQEVTKCYPEKEGMQKEIGGLKAQLAESSSALEHLKTQLLKICPMLRQAQKDVMQLTSTNKDQNVSLEHMKEEKEALQNKLHAERHFLAVSKNNVEVDLESYLQIEREENKSLQVALEKAECVSQMQCRRLELEKTTLQEQAEKSSAALLLCQEEKASLLTEFQQRKTSHATQLSEILRKAEQKLELDCMKSKDDRLTLFQATKSLQKTLQEKEQDWQKAESAMRSQVEDAECQIPKKREGWFPKFF
ncbi:LexA repressor [Dissostichus eleginoides]|uniref:LexA repressor n=1 Tax=Dissostichus eleginoides TaxID=100907 RepID=A0AAD9F1T8_DISEL|nr:LexA repressor [Dissostichus eleginoides]